MTKTLTLLVATTALAAALGLPALAALRMGDRAAPDQTAAFGDRAQTTPLIRVSDDGGTDAKDDSDRGNHASGDDDSGDNDHDSGSDDSGSAPPDDGGDSRRDDDRSIAGDRNGASSPSADDRGTGRGDHAQTGGEDDDDDDDGDDCDRAAAGTCPDPAGNPAPAGTVAPPRNGLFGNGKPPVAVVN